jgi:outer membrane receptor for ferrienterochelin and colicin
MKSLIKTTLVIALVALLGACAGSASTPGSSPSTAPMDYSTYATLGDVLRTVGGLQVRGSGQNLTAMVRGGAQNSITLSSLPLYVIDRVPIGTSYSDAASLVNPVEIEKISVLNGTRAVTLYGEPGNAGVIEIRTKKIK